jgi:hypothetical protein
LLNKVLIHRYFYQKLSQLLGKYAVVKFVKRISIKRQKKKLSFGD